jgi:hypothetical protein
MMIDEEGGSMGLRVVNGWREAGVVMRGHVESSWSPMCAFGN